MKKSSLFVLGLASLVGLVGCGNSSTPAPEPYATEKKLVTQSATLFFGNSAAAMIEVGDDVVYEGKDEQGNAVYSGGAAFDAVWYTTAASGDPVISLDEFLYTIGYQTEEAEEGEGTTVSAPLITELLNDEEYDGLFMNMTEQLYSKYATYIMKEGNEPYLYIPGSALVGAYALYELNSEGSATGVYLLSVEIDLMPVAVADLSTYFGADDAAEIQADALIVEDTVTFALASISCSYISLEE
ncbi:MAG: hypothetical protein J6M95_04865 [Bacilli bacterium]|nr:hypothetical protein [Bacilli bacterium]